jgi:thymidine kinase
LEDYCDGLLFHNHEIFQNHPCALQILAYYDELELCNALGSYVKKHKVGVVFFVLGNIHPKHRSRLQAINLVSIATAPVIQKHGIDEILRPFVDELNALSSSGIDVLVNGVNHNFKGALLAFLGDTLALHEVGGFKMSVSRALRICRTCMATSEKASTCFNSRHFEMRTNANHRQQCSQLCGPLREHYSTAYGVTHPSVLLDVTAYNMFNGGLPHDFMHNLFEGVVQYELKLLLQHLINNQTVNLEHLNQLLINFDYGYSEASNKPTPITHRNLQANDKHLRQNASQCALLCRILPLLVGEFVEEDNSHWQCYLLLLKIVQICLSPIVSTDLCAVLQVSC